MDPLIVYRPQIEERAVFVQRNTVMLCMFHVVIVGANFIFGEWYILISCFTLFIMLIADLNLWIVFQCMLITVPLLGNSDVKLSLHHRQHLKACRAWIRPT